MSLPTRHQVPAGIQELWGILPACTFKPNTLCISGTTAGLTLSDFGWEAKKKKNNQKEPNFAELHAAKLCRASESSNSAGGQRKETEQQKEELPQVMCQQTLQHHKR